METINCPACAGPDNAECETCQGTSLVTQEVYDTFMLNRERETATMQLKHALQSLAVENILGEQQSIVIITMANGEISATVDGVDMIWNKQNNSWQSIT